MTKGKNSQLMELCFFFCLTLGRASNEINKCSVFVKFSCGLFACCKVTCGLNYRCKAFCFRDEPTWMEIKSPKLMIFRWIIVCKDFIQLNQLERDKHSSLIRNEVLRDQSCHFEKWTMELLYLILELSVLMPSSSLTDVIHKKKYMRVCLISIKLELFYVVEETFYCTLVLNDIHSFRCYIEPLSR